MAVVIRTSSGSQPSRAESIEAIVRPENSATSASGRNQTR